jgi:hypothetical protein
MENIQPKQTSLIWTDAKKELPPYYQEVIIFDGNGTKYGWMRANNGKSDYYVRGFVNECIVHDITHWCNPADDENKPIFAISTGDALKALIKEMEANKSDNDNYNQGINQCIQVLQNKINKANEKISLSTK